MPGAVAGATVDERARGGGLEDGQPSGDQTGDDPGEHVPAPGGRELGATGDVQGGAPVGCGDHGGWPLQQHDRTGQGREAPRRVDPVGPDGLTGEAGVLTVVGGQHGRSRAFRERGRVAGEGVQSIGVEHDGLRDLRHELSDRGPGRVGGPQPGSDGEPSEAVDARQEVVEAGEGPVIGRGKRLGDDLGAAGAGGRLLAWYPAPDDPRASTHRRLADQPRRAGHPAGSTDDEHSGLPLVGVRRTFMVEQPAAHVAGLGEPERHRADVDPDVGDVHGPGVGTSRLEHHTGLSGGERHGGDGVDRGTGRGAGLTVDPGRNIDCDRGEVRAARRDGAGGAVEGAGEARPVHGVDEDISAGDHPLERRGIRGIGELHDVDPTSPACEHPGDDEAIATVVALPADDDDPTAVHAVESAPDRPGHRPSGAIHEHVAGRPGRDGAPISLGHLRRCDDGLHASR